MGCFHFNCFLSRINIKDGDTEKKYLKILEEFAKCNTTAEAEKFCSLPGNDVCFPYKLTRDQRTQVPRWNDPGSEQVHLSDADRCKKIYLNFDLVNLFHPHCRNRKGV